MLSPQGFLMPSPWAGLEVLREQEKAPQVLGCRGFQARGFAGLMLEPWLLSSYDCGCTRRPVAIPEQAHTFLYFPELGFSL